MREIPGFLAVVYSPDGKKLGTLLSDSTVVIWDAEKFVELLRIESKQLNRHAIAAFSPDGRLLVSGSGADFSGGDSSVRVWEIASGQEVRRFGGHRAGIY